MSDARALEIVRQDLTGTVLTLKHIGIAPTKIHFLDGPNAEQIQGAILTLCALEALGEQDNITELGKRISRLQVDPRLARAILALEGKEEALHVLIRTISVFSASSLYAYPLNTRVRG